MKINRRSFLVSASAGLAAAWLLPRTRAAGFSPGEAAEEPDVTYPLFGLRPWIGKYQPPSGTFAPDQAQTLKYAWKFWDSFAGQKKAHNLGGPGGADIEEFGSLSITRQPAPDAIHYQISQLRDGRTLTAQITCQPDGSESVREWTLAESRLSSVGEFKAETTGQVEGGQARVTRNGKEKVIPLDGPLVSTWALMARPDAVKNLAASSNTFTLADEMSMLRPGHRIQSDIDTPVPHAQTCATWLMTGRGTCPTHFIVDPDGAPVFTTQYMTSVVLTSIENAV